MYVNVYVYCIYIYIYSCAYMFFYVYDMCMCARVPTNLYVYISRSIMPIPIIQSVDLSAFLSFISYLPPPCLSSLIILSHPLSSDHILSVSILSCFPINQHISLLHTIDVFIRVPHSTPKTAVSSIPKKLPQSPNLASWQCLALSTRPTWELLRWYAKQSAPERFTPASQCTNSLPFFSATVLAKSASKSWGI